MIREDEGAKTESLILVLWRVQVPSVYPQYQLSVYRYSSWRNNPIYSRVLRVRLAANHLIAWYIYYCATSSTSSLAALAMISLLAGALLAATGTGATTAGADTCADTSKWITAAVKARFRREGMTP